MPTPVEASEGTVRPIASSKLRQNNLSAAVGLTTIPDGAFICMIQATVQNVRWWDDGSTPTATSGHQLAVGQTIVYTGGTEGMKAIRFIEEATTAVLNVTFYKPRD